MAALYNVKVMNAFIHGTVYVLDLMCGMSISPGKPYRKTNQSTIGDISGQIPLNGVDQQGIAVIAFSKEAILAIVSRMLSEEKTWMDKDVRDSVAEIANVVVGHARAKLEEIGLDYEGGIPMVVVGKGHRVYTAVSENTPVISIPFKTDTDHQFSIDFAFEQLN